MNSILKRTSILEKTAIKACQRSLSVCFAHIRCCVKPKSTLGLGTKTGVCPAMCVRNLSKKVVTVDEVFSEANKKRLQKHLLSPPSPRSSSKTSSDNLRQAAVLVPLCRVDGQPSILFTLRSSSLRKHRGQVSFPGGMMDETDEDVVHTALRETEEELGISMQSVDIWGTMGQIPTRDASVVTPVLGYCGELDINSLKLSEEEVEEVFTRSVASLCDPRNIRQTQFQSGYTMPVYLGGAHRVWGLTSFMLHQTLSSLAPGLYRFRLKHRS